MMALNIMHDGAHHSYSRQKTINWLMGFTLDLIGGSHVRWRQKHNILHHTYTLLSAKSERLDDLESRFEADLDNICETSNIERRSRKFEKWRTTP